MDPQQANRENNQSVKLMLVYLTPSCFYGNIYVKHTSSLVLIITSKMYHSNLSYGSKALTPSVALQELSGLLIRLHSAVVQKQPQQKGA